ncbi:MAG: serine/threonine protein kinase, partial [Planctomycetes bacterium]|nr:serine/threonine protein kinase [Planctomycetota bacterium]
HQGQPYFTMDFIEGNPLDRMLEKGPLNVRKAVGIIETAARAIAYAHSRGIIHRDIKPANIIVSHEGRPMITDFGLAVELYPDGEQQRRMTMAGSVMGTIPYAPPEQAAGKIDQITERSDIYSMGAVLYEMVTGRPPFTGFTQFELMRRVINQEPTQPRLINPKVHRDVETIILKCLEKDPRRRYVSAKAFADDCQSFLKGEVIAARPATIGYRFRRFLARRPFITFLSACVIALLMAVWFGIGHFRILAKEKEATEQALEVTLARAEQIALEKEETERQMHREWRSEYNLNFDYAFRWEADVERSRRLEIPWLNPQRARLLADPPRLALTDSEGSTSGSVPLPGEADLGFPFTFPRESRVALRLQTPAEGVGELLLMLDVDDSYNPHPATTTARFGSPGRPGAVFYRGEAVIGEDAAFFLKPNALSELVIERSDNVIRAFVDGRQILEAEDPPPVLPSEGGRMTLDVRDGTLEFFDLAVEVRSMSRSLAESLVEIANTMSARGRADLAERLYTNVLLEPTGPQNRLRALRGYARSLWMGLPRRERNVVGIENAIERLSDQLLQAGRLIPGEMEYLLGLALAFNTATEQDGLLALDRLDRAAAVAYSEGGDAGDYGDLARLEALFVYLRLGMLDEAARRFNIMFEDGATQRLYDRYGATLGAGGQASLLLEKVDPLIRDQTNLDTAAILLRAAAAIAPSSRECAQRFRRLALIHSRREELELASNFLHWAERLAPDWHRPYLDEALMDFTFDQPGLAKETLERAQAAIPQSLDLHTGVARLYLTELPARYQDPAEAEKAAARAVTISQNMSPLALELLAQAQFRLNRYEEALKNIDAAIGLENTETRQTLRNSIAEKAAEKSQQNGR